MLRPLGDTETSTLPTSLEEGEMHTKHGRPPHVLVRRPTDVLPSKAHLMFDTAALPTGFCS